jgi:hypothetical protein
VQWPTSNKNILSIHWHYHTNFMYLFMSKDSLFFLYTSPCEYALWASNLIENLIRLKMQQNLFTLYNLQLRATSMSQSIQQWSYYGLDCQRIDVQFLVGTEIFLFNTMSRLALGPTQPPIQWVSGLLPQVSGRGMKLTTHLHLLLSLKICGFIHSPIHLHGIVPNQAESLLNKIFKTKTKKKLLHFEDWGKTSLQTMVNFFQTTWNHSQTTTFKICSLLLSSECINERLNTTISQWRNGFMCII